MSYEQPTLDQFVEAYEEYAETPPNKIKRALTLAARRVDNTWMEGDFQTAIMALAAHLLSAREAGVQASGQDDIRSLSIGPLSLTYGEKILLSDYSTTIYGQEFADLLRRNFSGPVVLY